MKFLSEMKAGNPPVLSTKASSPTAYGMPRRGTPYRDDWDIDRADRDGLRKVVWVYRAIHAMADAQARLPIEVAQGSEEGQVIEDHELTALLNQAPNPDESAYVFRYRLTGTILLSRRGAYVEKILDRVGRITELRLLDPRKTTPISGDLTRGKDGRFRLISGFRVDLGGGSHEDIPADRVLWFRQPHPIDPLGGLTPLEAAGISIDIDILGRLYNRSFLQNDGRPGGIVGIEGDLDDETADFLEDRFNGGTRGVGRITVLETDGPLSFVDTAITPRDAQYQEGRKITKEDILGAFGVPESIALGNASARTFENVDAEREMFWDPTMLGHLALHADGWNQADEDPTTFVRFNLDKVEALQRAKIARRKDMRDEVAAGLRSIDSYREACGEETIGSADSTALWVPMGMVPLGAGPVAGQKMIEALAEEVGKRASAALEDRVVTPFHRRSLGS